MVHLRKVISLIYTNWLSVTDALLKAKQFCSVGSCGLNLVIVPSLNFFGQCNVHQNTDYDRCWKDDNVWNVCNYQDVNGHLRKAFLSEKSIRQKEDDNIRQAEQNKQDDDWCPQRGQWQYLLNFY